MLIVESSCGMYEKYGVQKSASHLHSLLSESIEIGLEKPNLYRTFAMEEEEKIECKKLNKLELYLLGLQKPRLYRTFAMCE